MGEVSYVSIQFLTVKNLRHKNHIYQRYSFLKMTKSVFYVSYPVYPKIG